MKMMVQNLFLVLSLISFLIACKSEGERAIAYPYPRPDSVPLKFMPGVVTSDNLDFNSCYSPDGQTFYFGRSENRKWTLYQTTFDGTSWSTPARASFNDSLYSEADPVFAPDGSLYYISNRPKDQYDTTRDYDIWRVKSMAENQWTAPFNVAIVNSDSNELYISFASNGNLYFSSLKEGGLGEEDIYLSRYSDEGYLAPINLGAQVNSEGSDHDPLITKDEGHLIFTSSDRKDSFGEADLYISKHLGDNKWRPAANLGKPFNTPTYEYCSYLSPDGQYFFYSSESDVKWVRSQYLFQEIEAK